MLTSPIPNPNVVTGDVLSGAFARGNSTWGLGGNGTLTSGSQVPNGTAYTGLNFDNDTTFMKFTLPADASMVGADVDVCGTSCTVQTNLVTMTVFSAGGTNLGSTTISGVPIAQWGRTSSA